MATTDPARTWQQLWPQPGRLPAALSDGECAALADLIIAVTARWGRRLPSATPRLPDPRLAVLADGPRLFTGDFGGGPQVQVAWAGRLVFDWLPASACLRLYRPGPWSAALGVALSGLLTGDPHVRLAMVTDRVAVTPP
ncbi:MAG: hypothetical protein H7338_10480 [Candidatus Sericytochromatia bacterium]|nr:hypothetical protein [Candidatus Sericytochromatia bacterium]